MSKKHTPGSWKAVAATPDERTFVETQDGDRLICFVEGSVGDNHSDYANARLIAAAPDLLKALERCISALAANGAPNCEAVKEARAAITKAGGGE